MKKIAIQKGKVKLNTPLMAEMPKKEALSLDKKDSAKKKAGEKLKMLAPKK